MTMLNTLQPGKDGKTSVTWDSDLPGLGCRTSRGKDGSVNRVLFLQYRLKGPPAREIKQTLGKVQELIRSNADLEKIRAHAADLRLDARTKGIDPRVAAKAVAMPTFAEFGDRYLKEVAKRHADGGASARRAVERASKHFGKKLINAVTTSDVEDFYRSAVDEFGPAAGKRAIAMLSTLFGRAEREELTLRSPTRHVKTKSSEPRDVVLTTEEMGRFWDALDQYSLGGEAEQMFANALRLLALTGARRGEVLTMAWSDVDLEKGMWRREASKNKNRKRFEAPLAPDACAILKDIRARRDVGPAWARKSPYVFASNRSRAGHISSLHAPFKDVLRLAGIPPERDVHIHDLRATFITVALSGGMQPTLLRHLTGHSDVRTLLKVYERLQSVDVLREGLAGVAGAWGAKRG